MLRSLSLAGAVAVLALSGPALAQQGGRAEQWIPASAAYNQGYTYSAANMAYAHDGLTPEAQAYRALKVSLKRENPARYALAEQVAKQLNKGDCAGAFSTAKAAGDVELAGKVVRICRG